MPSAALNDRRPDVSETRDAALLVDVVVLSSDLLLFDAIRGAIGERNPVWRARSAEESVDLLLTGRCGVLLLDMASVSTQPASLVAQIGEQFPDVVVVVAGRHEDEALLAQLISEGLVYRFMHKPLSAKRAGMFLQAAMRCHVERRASRSTRPLLALTTGLPERIDRSKWLFVAAGLALFVGMIGLLLGDHANSSAESEATAAPLTAARAAASGAPRADPVLSRARAALAAGRYEAPAGRNALDLYRAVLLAQPSQPEARAGLEKTIARLLDLAEQAAAAGDRTESRRLLERVRTADPGQTASERLAVRVEPQPRSAAASLPPAATAVMTTTPVRLATPHAAAPLPGKPAIAAPAVVRAPVVRDPLTPRFTNADELHAAGRYPGRHRGGGLHLGAPITSGLPTAGYVRAPPPDAVAAEAPTRALDADVVAALSLPADAMDRVFSTDPVYPTSALHDRVEGWVELMFTITETGAVRDIEIVDAQPRGVFETAATHALGNWRFRPRLANGQAVQRRSVVTVRFNLDG